MNFIAYNQEDFQTKSFVYQITTRNKRQIHKKNFQIYMFSQQCILCWQHIFQQSTPSSHNRNENEQFKAELRKILKYTHRFTLLMNFLMFICDP